MGSHNSATLIDRELGWAGPLLGKRNKSGMINMVYSHYTAIRRRRVEGNREGRKYGGDVPSLVD